MKKKIILSALATILIVVGIITYNIFGYSLFIQPQKITETNHKTTERGHLLSSKHIATISKNSINAYFPEQTKMQGNISEVPKYDIDLYKITYNSLYKDSIVELSGLVIVPQKEGGVTHLQYHHGTLLPYPAKDGWGNKDAPSLYKGNAPKTYKEQYETRLYGNYFGSYGYLVSLPDYAGYGISEKLEHPYSVNPELAKESVDMILATKEFAKTKNISLNKEVFLTGWSEGGAVSVATQKLIENNYQDKLKLLANAEMSGLLNVTQNMKNAFLFAPYMNEDMGENMDFLTWAYYAYNKFSDKPISFNNIFKFPVHTNIDVLKKRPLSIPSEALQKLTKTSYQHMINQTERSNLSSGWQPIAPLFLHHGTEDKTVPYDNNPEVALKYYKENGGTATLIKYEGHNHESLGLLYIENVIKEFEKIENNNKPESVTSAFHLVSRVVPTQN